MVYIKRQSLEACFTTFSSKKADVFLQHQQRHTSLLLQRSTSERSAMLKTHCQFCQQSRRSRNVLFSCIIKRNKSPPLFNFFCLCFGCGRHESKPSNGRCVAAVGLEPCVAVSVMICVRTIELNAKATQLRSVPAKHSSSPGSLFVCCFNVSTPERHCFL